jgi:hypothetical protein
MAPNRASAVVSIFPRDRPAGSFVVVIVFSDLYGSITIKRLATFLMRTVRTTTEARIAGARLPVTLRERDRSHDCIGDFAACANEPQPYGVSRARVIGCGEQGAQAFAVGRIEQRLEREVALESVVPHALALGVER